MITIDTGTTELLCEIRDRVAVVTLNNPDKRNALGDKITPALRDILVALEEDQRVGVVLITGAGDAFCSGGDVSGMASASKELLSQEDRLDSLIRKQENLTLRLHELKKVTIAALPGPAAGAGLSIALACDLRVASENAFITTAFRNIGLSGDYGGSWFLTRLVGLGKAKELFYTSPRIYAEEGMSLGIFNKVFDQENFLEQSVEFAKTISSGPTAALARMKINLNLGLNKSLKEALALEASHMLECAASEESKTAIKAFNERRQPVFHSEE